MKQINRTELKRVESSIDKRLLTIHNLAYEVMRIMKDCIGIENKISRNTLFKHIFGRDESPSLADWLRWEFVKKAMNHLRTRTDCFVISQQERGLFYYYVVSTMDDVQPYIDRLNKNIARMRTMQRRAVKSVQEGWYRRQWALKDYKPKTLYIGKD